MPLKKPKYPNVYHKVNRRFLQETWKQSSGHTVLPRKELTLNKLGLRKNEKIHFFAAHSGEWADALRNKGVNVDVSDITKEQLEKLRKIKFDRVIEIPGQLHNIVPEYYDWSISFEPIPLFEYRQMHHALRRGLLNKKGIKLIMAANFTYYEPYKKQLIDFAKSYDLNIELQEIDGTGEGRLYKLYLVTIETNSIARRNAELDIYVEKALINYTEINSKTIISLARYLGVSVGQILLSLNRLGIKRE